MSNTHQRHRHSSSFLSSLSGMLNIRSQLPPANTLPAERVHNDDGFEANLAQRLSLLLPPEGTPFVGLACFRQAMVAHLATVSDLRVLLLEQTFSLSLKQHNMIENFLNTSGNLFDACNVIREAILEVQRWEKLLEVVLLSLGGKQGHFIEAQLRRSRKILGNLKSEMDMGRGIEPSGRRAHHRSWRWTRRHSRESQPHRWSSWHGNPSGSSSRARSLCSNLSVPKYTNADMEDCLSASLYALHVISAFFLSTIMAALPCQRRRLVASVAHPRHFLWAIPLLNLQNRVLEETRKRSKGITIGFFWELYQIWLHVSQLFEFTDKALGINVFPLSTDSQEEMKMMVTQLSYRVQELETDLGPLGEQVTDIFQCLIKTRLELLNLLRDA